MAMTELERAGRGPRGYKTPTSGSMRDFGAGEILDTAVSDRGKTMAPGTAQRLGFASSTGISAAGVSRRDDKDRRPGTPIPFHEPDPDRLAKAEALRQSILAQEKRRGLGAYGRKIVRQPEPAKRMFYGAAVSKLPDVPVDKVWPHYNCPEAGAAVRGERDGVVMLFASAVKAQTAMTGRENNGKNVANAAAGITLGAYGWQWSRLKGSKTGPKQAPVRGRTPAK